MLRIPPGLQNKETIRYPKIINGIDIIATFKIIPESNWRVENGNVIQIVNISIWDLIIGGEIIIETVYDELLKLRIPPKTQPNTLMRIKGKGIKNRHRPSLITDMLVQLNAIIPDDISEDLLESIKKNKG